MAGRDSQPAECNKIMTIQSIALFVCLEFYIYANFGFIYVIYRIELFPTLC